MKAVPTGAAAITLRRAAVEVRSAGVGIPGYGQSIDAAAAELDRCADEIEAIEVDHERVRPRSKARRLVVAAVVLVTYVVTAGGAYQLGARHHTETTLAEPSASGSHAVVPMGPGTPAAKSRAARGRACSTLAESYPSLSAELRAHGTPPTQVVPPNDSPNKTVHGEATDLAEILNADLGPAYAYLQRPWPPWVQAFDNYIAALRAVSFIETNSTAPQVRAGIMDLYRQALAEPLTICDIPE